MLAAKLLLFIAAAQAFPWDGARPTDNLNLPLRNVEPPQPTGAALLRPRQAAGDNTCAYEDGKGTQTYQLYCASQKVCATNSLGGFGCCDTKTIDDCPLNTACIDSTALSKYSSSYGTNDFAVSCTAPQNPNCVTQLILLNPIVTAYLCGPANGARTETYYTTYPNATAAKTKIPPTYYNAAYLSYTTPVLQSSTQSTTGTTTTTAPPTTSSSASSISSPTPTPTPTPDSGSSSAPIGAIVGGTVGGVALLAGLALLAYFLFQRSKRQKNSQPPETGGQPPMQQPQGPPPAQYPQSPTQSAYGFAGQAPQQEQYPTNQGFYPEKNPGQSAVLTHGSPETSFSSPNSPTPDRMSSVPPYTPRHELGG